MSKMNCPSASFTCLAISCIASRNTNEPTACIPPQLRLYLPHFAAAAASFSRWRLQRSDGRAIAAVAVSFVAVAVPLDKCRCIRSGSGAVPAVAGQLERYLCNGLTAVAVSPPCGPRHCFQYTSGVDCGLLITTKSKCGKQNHLHLSCSSSSSSFPSPSASCSSSASSSSSSSSHSSSSSLFVFFVRLVLLVLLVPPPLPHPHHPPRLPHPLRPPRP